MQLEGESQLSKESRGVLAQASQGVKRRAEEEGDFERIRDNLDIEKDPSTVIIDYRKINFI